MITLEFLTHFQRFHSQENFTTFPSIFYHLHTVSPAQDPTTWNFPHSAFSSNCLTQGLTMTVVAFTREEFAKQQKKAKLFFSLDR